MDSEEFEIPGEEEPIVEMDFSLSTTDGIWLGEAKTVDSLADTPRERKREVCKLIEGCLAVSASRLIRATTQVSWAETTVQAVRNEVVGRRMARKHTPWIRLLTDAGGHAQCVLL
ncbi:hypothetical protein AB0D11_40075 [Streptomyces monashensis]|uniref:hypothetical protein n=1 Tax=Streptomyces monashensis TaxID=1678012 RepID=UPI0033F2DFD0